MEEFNSDATEVRIIDYKKEDILSKEE